MNKMQREYLKKWLIGIAILVGIVLLIACAFFGSPWHYLPLVACLGLVVFLFGSLIVGAIGTMIWHWRLMGECKNAWECDLLDHWWFWIYRSDKWESYIIDLIHEEYGAHSNIEQEALNFYNRLREVKKPRICF